MPAFYAHRRFGAAVLGALPELKERVGEDRALFDIGLHGPDLFFFYRPVLPNAVNRLGHDAHRRSGREFLHRGKALIARSPSPEKTRAYLYGLMGHFLLDSVCHPYIAQAMKEFRVTHAAVETAFDRCLLLADRHDPLRFDPCGHFAVTRGNAAVIAPFYPPALTDTVEKSLRSMVFYGRLLYSRNRALRGAIDKALYVTLHHDAIADMMMTEKQDLRCRESDGRLLALLDDALAEAPAFFAAVDAYLSEGEEPGAAFDKTFSG